MVPLNQLDHRHQLPEGFLIGLPSRQEPTIVWGCGCAPSLRVGAVLDLHMFRLSTHSPKIGQPT